ncbi:MAG: putative O-glycosylation ligase, exosortase A system-associated [Calditrichaeota bacterium]|nr:putative O-glycosylation ligase, exosortase A system-associated [Calditrichota bacterium]
MRDYLILAIVFSGVPISFFKPYIGILYWAWISFMNPHRYAWGIAEGFPVALLVAVSTILGYIFSKEKRFPQINITVLLLLALWIQFFHTTFFSLNPQNSFSQLIEINKILIMSLITLSLIYSKIRFEILFFVVSISIGLLGLKGGIWVLSGGKGMVWGPGQSFLADNNDFALALNMILPMLFFQAKNVTYKWFKLFLYTLFIFSIISIIFTFSRGGFLGLITVLLLIMMKTRRSKYIILVFIITITGYLSAPQKYIDRILTIETSTSEETADGSVRGRFNAWHFAFNLALDHPFTGGGFDTFTPELFIKYAPDPYDFHDAHSIFFEILAEQGFIGLFLFLALLSSTYILLHRIRIIAMQNTHMLWMVDYTKMFQISLLAYIVNGLTLGRAYFDLQYYLIIGTLILNNIINLYFLKNNNISVEYTEVEESTTSF